MATNLIDMLLGAVTPQLTSSLGKEIGGSDSLVSSALGSLLPTLIGGMAHKASSSDGASSVFSMLTGGNVDGNIASTIGGLLGAGQTSGLMDVGTKLLGGLFGGDRVGALGQALGESSGLSAASAKNLAVMVAPIAFGLLKKFITGNSLNAGGVAGLLRDQVPFLANKLDPRLTAALGLGTPASLLGGLGARVGAAAGAAGAAVTGAAGAAVHGAGAAATAGASGIGRWLPWLIGAAAIAFLVSQLGNCSGTPKVAAPAPAAPAPAVTVAPAPAAFAMPAKVYFDTGSATINIKGGEAIANAATWMKADASRKVAITGYTDKTGDLASNEKLAKDRALAVRAALEAAGVTTANIEMKPPLFVEAGTGGAEAEARRVEINGV